MTFLWPLMLLLLFGIPLCVVWYTRRQTRRRELVARYGSLGLIRGPAGRDLGLRRHLPPLLFLLSLGILIVALARPVTSVSLPQLEGTIILAFDVSASMNAEDLTPTRMEAAKAAARAFVERQPRTVRIGVVSFSDSSFPAQSPTNERGEIIAAINRLAPQRGTSLGNGILMSIQALSATPATRYYSNATPTPTPLPTPMPRGTYTNGAIILLTDGENNTAPDPLEVAQVAADRGIRIYPVGIGSTAGTEINVEGFTLYTQLDEPMLQQIAQVTGGQYFSAVDAEGLQAIYGALNTALVMKTQDTEVTALVTGVGLLVLLVGASLSMAWFSRLP